MANNQSPPQSTGFAAPTDESVAGLVARLNGAQIWKRNPNPEAQSWGESHYVDETELRNLLSEAAKALLASEARATALEAEVKALPWKRTPDAWLTAETFFGVYHVERNPHDKWCWALRFHGEQGTGLNPDVNEDAAKAAAQADYEARIRSALTASQTGDARTSKESHDEA